MTGAEQLDLFVRLSAVLTGFRRVDLQGTGMAEAYLGEIQTIAGEGLVDLFEAARPIFGMSEADAGKVEGVLQEHVLKSPRFGPLARNLIRLWYTGMWNQLPQAWRNTYGSSARDTDRVVSPAAFREGLVWTAMDAHPRGAKPQGFGAWSLPPPAAGPRRPARGAR